MPPEITVEAPTQTLTASQVRRLLADVERKEQAAKVLTVKDVQPGQFFKYLNNSPVADIRFKTYEDKWVAPDGAIYERHTSSECLSNNVILVRNFDGDPL